MPAEKENSKVIPNGAAWAGILAAGAGCAVLGALIDAAEASKSVSNLLNFYKPSGDLSGKTTVAVFIWLVVWAGLHAMWRNRELKSTKTILAVTLILILLGLIAVFPPFFSLFAAD